MNREDYIVDKDDTDAVKAFETQRDKMDEILIHEKYELQKLILINF